MKKILTVLLVVLVSAGTFCGVAGAAGQAAFSSTELNRFINDWPVYAKWAKQQGKKYESLDSIAGIRFGHEVASFVEGLGWKPERFFYVAAQSARGLVAAEMRAQSPRMSEQMEQSRKAIMANPNLSAKQKKQMLSSMGQSQQAVTQMKSGEGISPKEMALITTNRKRLKRAFGIK